MILNILVSSISIHGQDNKRIAIIEDASGVITETENLQFGTGDRITVLTETFQIIIPIKNLISIKREDDIENKVFLVKYYWAEKERTITGKFTYKRFTGQTDFGEFSIDSDYSGLKQITFNQDAEKAAQKEVFNPDGYLLLRNGDQVEFKDLKRAVLRATTRKEVIDPLHYAEVPAGTYETLYENFPFKRGESNLLLEFKDIRSIEFGEKTGEFLSEQPLTITLKNGKSTSGTIPYHENDIYMYPIYKGWLESGEFTIERRNIKAIHFTTK